MTHLDTMKQALEALHFHNLGREHVPQKSAEAITALRLAIEQAEKQEPVKFLANGTRFKMAFFDTEEDGCGNQGTYVTCFEGFEKELDGRWVALVAAEDDCHRSLAAPPQRQPLPDEVLEALWEADTTSDEDCQSLYFFKLVARLVEKQHGIGGEA